LEHAGFLEGMILEVAGTQGVLRVDLACEELQQHLRSASPEERAKVSGD
jgi:hypothetical protein